MDFTQFMPIAIASIVYFAALLVFNKVRKPKEQ